jgi:RNA polymerase sigma-70 factor (ECF subfamily)
MTGALNDHGLVAACRAGQTEAFGVLVGRYQDRLFPTLVRMLGSREDAQDLVQDAFVKAFQKLDQFQGDSSFYTWIYRIAVNLALSDRRSRRHRLMNGLQLHDREGAGVDRADPSPESDPVAVLDRREREGMVEEALRKLCPEHRAVIILKDFDGHRYDEIAAILNIPVGTVRSRLHRARSELRGLLGDALGPEHSPGLRSDAAESVLDA